MFPCKAGSYRRVAVGCLLPILTTTCAYAAESSRVIANPLVTLGKLAVALVVVLALFWVFARVMRQVQGFQSGMHQGLKIVGTLSVGQRERVIVVQAGNEQLVLGVTGTQINTLHVLEHPLVQSTPLAAQGDFRAKLSAALKRQVVT